jgi:hypothetical protein
LIRFKLFGLFFVHLEFFTNFFHSEQGSHAASTHHASAHHATHSTTARAGSTTRSAGATTASRRSLSATLPK